MILRQLNTIPMMTYMLKPDDIVIIRVTALEAHLIKVIRDVMYGEVVVKKSGGSMFNIFANKSIKLDPEGGRGLIVSDKTE